MFGEKAATTMVMTWKITNIIKPLRRPTLSPMIPPSNAPRNIPAVVNDEKVAAELLSAQPISVRTAKTSPPMALLQQVRRPKATIQYTPQ